MQVGLTGVNKTKVLGFEGKWYKRRDTCKKDLLLSTGHRYVCPEGCGEPNCKSFLENGPPSSNCGQLIKHEVRIYFKNDYLCG